MTRADRPPGVRPGRAPGQGRLQPPHPRRARCLRAGEVPRAGQLLLDRLQGGPDLSGRPHPADRGSRPVRVVGRRSRGAARGAAARCQERASGRAGDQADACRRRPTGPAMGHHAVRDHVRDLRHRGRPGDPTLSSGGPVHLRGLRGPRGQALRPVLQCTGAGPNHQRRGVLGGARRGTRVRGRPDRGAYPGRTSATE